MIVEEIHVSLYQTENGKVPYNDWFDQLDLTICSIISVRLANVKKGTLGNHKLLTQTCGVWELKFQMSSGLRIYFGKKSNSRILLLVGGTKKSQSRDIRKSIEYWSDHKTRTHYEQKEFTAELN